MDKKEAVTKQEVAETLDRIEEATLEEAIERRRLGLAQEPEGVRVPRSGEREYLRAKAEKSGKEPADFIKEWEERNGDYKFRNEDVAKADIVNETGIDMSAEFVDHLIGNARKSLEEKNLDIIGEIAALKIKKGIGDIIVAAKNKSGGIAFLHFYNIPPFDLKESRSHLGAYTFN